MARTLLDPRAVTPEYAATILPVNFGASGVSRGTCDGAFEFTIDIQHAEMDSASGDVHGPDLMTMIDEMRAWLRFHVTTNLHDPMQEDYLPKQYWIGDEDITIEMSVQDGWEVDHDCDGSQTYRRRWGRMRVYVDHVTDVELAAIIQHAPAERDCPSWVTGW